MYGSFLAPIFDYTDLPFRLLCQKYGAEACCVPMVNSLAMRVKKPEELVDAHPDEKNVGVQVVGEDPEMIWGACKSVADSMPFISWLNLNCGCPSPRTMGCGGGSAMLEKPDRIVSAVERMRRAGLPVSVKIRIAGGVDGTLRICRKLEKAGADFIIIHGRTAEQGYSGKCDWELIRRVAGAIGIPIVGNGDLESASDGRRMLDGGCCDSFMVGRAAMANPMLFCDRKPSGMRERAALLSEYAALCEKYRYEAPLTALKLKAINFTSGMENAAAARAMINRAASVEEITGVMEGE